MTNLERLMNGVSLEHTPIKQPTEKEMYEFMHEQGKKRFGSECRHDQTKNGKCLNCFRTVIDK